MTRESKAIAVGLLALLALVIWRLSISMGAMFVPVMAVFVILAVLPVALSALAGGRRREPSQRQVAQRPAVTMASVQWPTVTVASQPWLEPEPEPEPESESERSTLWDFIEVRK